MSDSSDSLNKARVVYVVLPITVMWCGVDEPTLKTPYFFSKKKKENEKEKEKET